MDILRLSPDGPAHTTVAEAYGAPLRDPADHHRRTGRPYVALTMIAALDGSTAIDRESTPLPNDTDAAVLRQARSLADVILIGASTVRIGGYRTVSRPGQRIAVVSSSLDLDLAAPPFTTGDGFLVTTDDAAVPPGIEVVRAGSRRVDIGRAMEALGVLGIEHVSAEGGSRLNGAVLDAGEPDELNLTLSPRLVGGEGPRLTRGAAIVDHRLELAAMFVDEESYVFSRWRKNEQTSR
ncbi:MAG: dihydrofolate reductase family protein [Actinomycetota bacterium]